MNILLKPTSQAGQVITTGMVSESFTGSDCTGSDGDLNRVLTTSDVTSAIGTIIVAADKQFLRETIDYTYSGNDITFLFKLWDSMKLEVRYLL